MVAVFQVFLEGLILWALALCAISFIALLVGAIWMHGDAQKRRMDATLWLILLIIATLFGNVVGFIIVFVAYLIVRENHPIGGVPYGYGPYRAPPVSAACPVCGGPMTWYPQYQRWYCPTCAQYR